MGNNSTNGRMVTGVRESDGGRAAEVGVMTGNVKFTRTPKSQTSSSNTSRLDKKEMAGSGAGSSWCSSSPNNYARKETTMSNDLSTIIYPNASISTGTISDISGGQVEARWSMQEGLGLGSMGMGA